MALQVARDSVVLLKNSGGLLPLETRRTSDASVQEAVGGDDRQARDRSLADSNPVIREPQVGS